MKKILSLALVAILLMTSLFTGFVVSAEETETETPIWIKEDAFGNTVDYSIYPGYTYAKGAAWPYYGENDPLEVNVPGSGAILRNYEASSEFSHNRTAQKLWAPVVALNAGKSGAEGDNALRLGAAMPLAHSAVVFTNHNRDGGYTMSTNNKYRVSFDVKVLTAAADLTGEVYLHANTSTWGNMGGIDHDSNAETPKVVSMTSNPPSGADKAVNAYGTTEGYLLNSFGSDWQNVTFDIQVKGQRHYLYINIDSHLNQKGCVVLIDNIAVIDKDGNNLFNADKFSSGAYNDKTTFDQIARIQHYFGAFDTITESITATGANLAREVDSFGNLVDYSVYPGYWLAGGAWAYAENVDPHTVTCSVEGAPITYTSFGWNGTARKNWAPVIALGAGKTGLAGDNALRLGVNSPTGTAAIAFYMRNRAGGTMMKSTETKYRISFDVKVLTPAADLVEDVYISANITNTLPRLGTDTDGDGTKDAISMTCYHEGATFAAPGWDASVDGDFPGYNLKDLGSGWTTVSYNGSIGQESNFFYINVSTLTNAKGGVVLIDNVSIINEDGTQIFITDNVKTNSTDHDLVLKPNYYLGTFDAPVVQAEANVIDPEVTYVPVTGVQTHSATVAPTISAAGEGFAGSYAIDVPVNESGRNTISFQAYNQGATDSFIGGLRTYKFEFKAKVKTGSVAGLKVGLGTNGKYNVAEAGLYPDFAALEKLSDTGVYSYPSYRDYRLNLASATDETVNNYAKVLNGEWQTFSFTTPSTRYEGVYPQLFFDLTGADATTVIQLDDIRCYLVEDGELTALKMFGHDDNASPSSFDLVVTTNKIVNINDTENIVVLPKVGVTVAELPEVMGLYADFQYGYYNEKLVFAEYPSADKFEAVEKDGVWQYDALTDTTGAFAADALVGTSNVLVLKHLNGQTGKVYKSFNIAVKNDLTGDGELDATDIVRAKRIALNDIEATDTQIAAAGCTAADQINVSKVASIRTAAMK